MTKAQLAKIAEAAKCRVFGWEDAGNEGHRLALATLIHAFNNTDTTLLCEPSLARKTKRPADIVLIESEIGVHVFEIKGTPLDKIERLEAGGQIHFHYGSRVRKINPLTQARLAMFDIKDATVQAFGGAVRLPFKYWVVFPLITRSAWSARFGKNGFCADEFLFAGDLDAAHFARRLGASDRSRGLRPIALCSLDQLQCVLTAFGDTSVLYASPQERSPRTAGAGTLGERFDLAAEAYKALSKDQQELSIKDWENGPRLVRGVAGSGKTVVLANNIARRAERMLIAHGEGSPGVAPAPPKLLAVCYNRTLAPYIEKKVNAAYQQRNGRTVPQGVVEVCSFNKLMWKLTTAGLWKYQTVSNARDIVRAMQYLGDLESFRQRNPDRLQTLAYDAIYVDEGQDFYEEEFRLLKELCRTRDGSEPNLYIFYDDAQNLYGRGRPNWQSLGLNMRGRSHVMTECFRNTRPIVEAAFNVLYGTCAAAPGQVPTKEFGDIANHERNGLIENNESFWRVRFARRQGSVPRLSLVAGMRQEYELLIARLRWLISEQQVRPEDILVLSHRVQRIAKLAEAIAAAGIEGIDGIHVASDKNQKDQPLGQKGKLTLSTVASAKGYDAYCVLLASANEFPTDVKGRASFYVGCTRAIEYLEVLAYEKRGLATEFESVLARLVRRPASDCSSAIQ